MSSELQRAIRRRHARRRERIATAVLAGLHANPATASESCYPLAERAVEAADALLSHLAAAESRDWLRAHEAQHTDESEVTA